MFKAEYRGEFMPQEYIENLSMSIVVD